MNDNKLARGLGMLRYLPQAQGPELDPLDPHTACEIHTLNTYIRTHTGTHACTHTNKYTVSTKMIQKMPLTGQTWVTWSTTNQSPSKAWDSVWELAISGTHIHLVNKICKKFKGHTPATICFKERIIHNHTE